LQFVAAFGVLDYLDRQHLGVFLVTGGIIPPGIPPEQLQRPVITG